VVQDVVAGGDGLVDDVEADRSPDAEEVDFGNGASDRENSSRNPETHAASSCKGNANHRMAPRIGNDEF
jgi:hypothetical protein